MRLFRLVPRIRLVTGVRVRLFRLVSRVGVRLFRLVTGVWIRLFWLVSGVRVWLFRLVSGVWVRLFRLRLGLYWTLRLPIVGGGSGVVVVVRVVRDDRRRLHSCNLVTVLNGQRDVAAQLHLTNSISNPQVEVGLLDNIDQRSFRLPPGCGCHGFIRPQHCHP